MIDYKSGFEDGLRAFAIHRNGEQWIGSPERRLRDVLAAGVEHCYGYLPPAPPPAASMMPSDIIAAAVLLKRWAAERNAPPGWSVAGIGAVDTPAEPLFAGDLRSLLRDARDAIFPDADMHDVRGRIDAALAALQPATTTSTADLDWRDCRRGSAR